MPESFYAYLIYVTGIMALIAIIILIVKKPFHDDIKRLEEETITIETLETITTVE